MKKIIFKLIKVLIFMGFIFSCTKETINQVKEVGNGMETMKYSLRLNEPQTIYLNPTDGKIYQLDRNGNSTAVDVVDDKGKVVIAKVIIIKDFDKIYREYYGFQIIIEGKEYATLARIKDGALYDFTSYVPFIHQAYPQRRFSSIFLYNEPAKQLYKFELKTLTVSNVNKEPFPFNHAGGYFSSVGSDLVRQDNYTFINNPYAITNNDAILAMEDITGKYTYFYSLAEPAISYPLFTIFPNWKGLFYGKDGSIYQISNNYGAGYYRTKIRFENNKLEITNTELIFGAQPGTPLKLYYEYNLHDLKRIILFDNGYLKTQLSGELGIDVSFVEKDLSCIPSYDSKKARIPDFANYIYWLDAGKIYKFDAINNLCDGSPVPLAFDLANLSAIQEFKVLKTGILFSVLQGVGEMRDVYFLRSGDTEPEYIFPVEGPWFFNNPSVLEFGINQAELM